MRSSFGTQIETYAALLPARFQLYQLGPSCPANNTNDHACRVKTCWEADFQGDGFWANAAFGQVCPFLLVPGSARLVRPYRRDIPSYRSDAFPLPPPDDPGFKPNNAVDYWQTYALGNLQGNGKAFDVWKIEHPGDYLNGNGDVQGLFAPISHDGDLSKGGLGANREQFFLSAFSGDHAPILVAPGNAAHAPGQKVQPIPLPESGPFWGGRATGCHDTP
jgi:hypothetical protein